MNTIMYRVTYKTEPSKPQHYHDFNSQQAAIAFAFDTEVNGGVAVITTVEKREPLASTRTLQFYQPE